MAKEINLLQYDTSNVQRGEFGGQRKAAFSVSKNGTFRLNKKACETLGVAAGDHVALLQDNNSPGDWYLRTDDEDGFELRSNKAGGLVFQSSRLRDTVWESLGVEDGMSLPIGEKRTISDIPVWPLFSGTASGVGEEEEETEEVEN